MTNPALTTFSQLGGNRAMFMVGGKNIVAHENTLSFTFGRNASKLTSVRITLDPNDTYTMTFMKKAKGELVVVNEVDGVYAGMLKPIFERTTGMYLNL